MDGTLHIWDPVTGEEIVSWQADADKLDAVAFSPDGGRLATTGKGGALALGLRHRARVGWLEPSGAFHSVAFSPIGRLAAGGASDPPVDADTGRLLPPPGHHSSVGDITFSPDGQRLVSGAMT
jgi:WD40 repeat protein